LEGKEKMGIIEKLRLDDKKTLVTGGARGIGYTIALALAEAGADVAIVDTDEETAKKSAEAIAAATGRKTLALKTDVTQKAGVDAMITDMLKAFGRIDAAFCNAGICMNIPAEEMSLEDWNKVITINLTGVFLTAQAAGKVMIRQGGGSIINTASMSAHIVNVPQPQCSYNASKAGVIQLTKSLAVEWALKKVRVNSISPGYIGTDLIQNSPALRPLIEQWNAMAPLKRLGRPDELQAIAVYLAGDSSAFTTGSDFVIDGAFTCI
jgi:NAD(P)-dependent dehydrogenase (short-subunit alcohol dehydrogenase family)